MKLVYVIGGMCSGKSSVLQIFEKLRAHTIDFDLLAHELIHSSVTQHLFRNTSFDKYFGEYGLIDEAGFSIFLFSSKDILRCFNRLFFPIVRRKLDELLGGMPDDVVIIEYSGWDGTNRHDDIFLKNADFVIGVTCSDKIREERALLKFGNIEEFHRRLALQPSLSVLVEQCDYVIDNSGDKEVLADECAKLWTTCCE